jgi:hypothetical protein
MAASVPTLSSPATAPPASTGLFTDLYEVTATLGAGSFGRVHRGVRRRDGLCVAIKYLNPDAYAFWRERVLEEIRLLAWISAARVKVHEWETATVHTPKLIEWFDVPASPGSPKPLVIIVTELAEGGELFTCLKDGLLDARTSLSDAERFHLARRVLKALSKELYVLHARDIIHRDIKLENILVQQPLVRGGLPDDGATFLLADVGLAWERSRPDLATRSGIHHAGSHNWRAPEVLRTPAEYGPAGDVYSLGLAALRILVPNMNTAKWLLDNLPTQFRFEGVVDLFSRMLADDPAARPTAQDVIRTPWLWDKSLSGSLAPGAPVEPPPFDRDALIRRMADALNLASPRLGGAAGAILPEGGDALAAALDARLRAAVGDCFAGLVNGVLTRGARRADVLLPLLEALDIERIDAATGLLSLECVPADSLEVFCRAWDKNGDGVLDRSEMSLMKSVVKVTASEHAIAQQLAELTRDADQHTRCKNELSGPPCGACCYFYINPLNKNAGVALRVAVSYADLVDAFRAGALKVKPAH